MAQVKIEAQGILGPGRQVDIGIEPVCRVGQQFDGRVAEGVQVVDLPVGAQAVEISVHAVLLQEYGVDQCLGTVPEPVFVKDAVVAISNRFQLV